MKDIIEPQNQMNSDSSGDEIATNYEGYSSNQMNPLQAPLQYQNPIPPQPIYPNQSNPYFQAQPQPPYPSIQQPQYYPNTPSQPTFSQPPPSQSEIMTNEIEKFMITCGTVIQIIFILYLLGYSFWDIIYQVVEKGKVNIAFVDGFY